MAHSEAKRPEIFNQGREAEGRETQVGFGRAEVAAAGHCHGFGDRSGISQKASRGEVNAHAADLQRIEIKLSCGKSVNFVILS
jgi:hypothetical protein